MTDRERQAVIERMRDLAQCNVYVFKQRCATAGAPRYPETNEETYCRVASFELAQERGAS